MRETHDVVLFMVLHPIRGAAHERAFGIGLDWFGGGSTQRACFVRPVQPAS